MMQPKIVDIADRKLIGMRIKTSLSENKTFELWRKFKPRVKEITGRMTTDFYSVQVYGEDFNVENPTPNTMFEKWAAVEVSNFENVPHEMESYTLASGKYAVFIHKGTPNDFPQTAEFIFGKWLPNSKYELNNCPHFEILSDQYKPDDPNAEEQIWIPIKESTRLKM